ncbi:MAG: HdeD family acid-resistance protein [Planctomycetota bacterium]|nr:HdeD family acid-resistance protein [Planctomycetota bacterium]
MITPSPSSTILAGKPELQRIRDHWPWFLALGIAMTVAGVFAISYSCIATVTAAGVLIFGFILFFAGISEIVHSFWIGRWSGLLFHLLIGLLYLFAGLMIIDAPERAAIQLTLLIAVFLMFSGIFRVVFAVGERFTGWGWVMLNGMVTFFLGMLIYKGWPESSLWVIGMFIGIDLIFNGWTWIALSLGMRSLPKGEPVAA